MSELNALKFLFVLPLSEKSGIGVVTFKRCFQPYPTHPILFTLLSLVSRSHERIMTAQLTAQWLRAEPAATLPPSQPCATGAQNSWGFLGGADAEKMQNNVVIVGGERMRAVGGSEVIWPLKLTGHFDTRLRGAGGHLKGHKTLTYLLKYYYPKLSHFLRKKI
ncbi:hypothetical protein BDQ17DRAFT_1332286 [Cyathus striatus]|nr:hypothetical protein BDQ17DRAFT_1332286 [Cyathus striatus]